MKKLVKLDLFVGINGSTLRFEDSREMVKNLPLSHMLIQTSSPYNDLRRNHPCFDFI